MNGEIPDLTRACGHWASRGVIAWPCRQLAERVAVDTLDWTLQPAVAGMVRAERMWAQNANLQGNRFLDLTQGADK